MNKTAVMLSIRPEWCCLIAQGKKNVEVRKTRPKIKTPFKCYIYCTESGRPLVYGAVRCLEGYREEFTQTYGYSKEEARKIWAVYNGHVMGEFVCDSICPVLLHPKVFAGKPLFYTLAMAAACLTKKEIEEYSKGKDLYGWHISDLVIYDTPKRITEFFTESNATHDCPALVRMKRPPQSWCYCEEDDV